MPRKRAVTRNLKNTPFEIPTLDKMDSEQMKKKDLQERIARQREREAKMIPVVIDSRTIVLCRPNQVKKILKKY